MNISVRSLMLFCLALAVTCIRCSKQAIEHPAKIPAPTIIYTDIVPDTPLKGFSPSKIFNLDLNGDGVTDFEISRETKNYICDPLSMFYFTTINLSVKPASVNSAIISTGSDQAIPLDSSVAILPDSRWESASQLLLTGARGHYRCVASFRSSGLWSYATEKYLGLKFMKNNQVYYGWARLTITLNTTADPRLRDIEITIQDYAYNNIANQPVFAGQTR